MAFNRLRGLNFVTIVILISFDIFGSLISIFSSSSSLLLAFSVRQDVRSAQSREDAVETVKRDPGQKKVTSTTW